MREDYGSLPMTIHDDGFGDIGFDADGTDFMRDNVADPTIDIDVSVKPSPKVAYSYSNTY